MDKLNENMLNYFEKHRKNADMKASIADVMKDFNKGKTLDEQLLYHFTMN